MNIIASLRPTAHRELTTLLKERLHAQTKPPGSLGRLEDLAIQIALVQQTQQPALRDPTLLIFAADHGIAASGVSAYPQELTRQMVGNFLAGGAAANVLARQADIKLLVVDAGVKGALPAHPSLLSARVGDGTASFAEGPAMSLQQLQECFRHAAAIIKQLSAAGCNTILLGEMGIGNSSSAACLMAAVLDLPLAACVGRGTGLSAAALAHKQTILAAAFASYAGGTDPLQALQYFGGFEIAMLVAAYLHAAAEGMFLVVDGFIATTAFLVAQRLEPHISDYACFAHCSAEHGHARLLAELQAEPLFSLGLRLGEGTGAALALPIIRSALALFNEMASFHSAGLSPTRDQT